MDKATKDKLKLVFTQCDKDKSGYVEQNELSELFEKMNVAMDQRSFRNVVYNHIYSVDILYNTIILSLLFEINIIREIL